MGLVAPRPVGSSQTRARTRVPCIGRRILNHRATREVPLGRFLRRRVTSFLTSLGIFCTDSSNKEDAIEGEDEEEEDEEEEDDGDDLEVKEENGVLVLNDANFDNFVADKDTVLLEFYAPW